MGFLLSLSDLRQRSQLCSSNSEGTHGWEGMGESTEDNRQLSKPAYDFIGTRAKLSFPVQHPFYFCLFVCLLVFFGCFFLLLVVFLRLIFRALKGKLLETTCKCFLHY